MSIIGGLLAKLALKPLLRMYSKGHQEAFGPSLDEIEKTHGKKVRDEVDASTHTYGVQGTGTGFKSKWKKGGGVRKRINNGACGPNGVL